MAIEPILECPSCVSLADEVEHLKLAIEHRDVIGQAKGILMAREHCNADAAFSILRMASQRENRKLYEIALELVERAPQSRRATVGAWISPKGDSSYL